MNESQLLNFAPKDNLGYFVQERDSLKKSCISTVVLKETCAGSVSLLERKESSPGERDLVCRSRGVALMAR